MKMKKVGTLVLYAIMMLTALGCGSTASQTTATKPDAASNAPKPSTSTESKPSSSTESKPVTINLGHGLTPQSLYHAGALKFKEEVEAKSNGKIIINVHSDGSIGQDADLVNFLKTANVQMGLIGIEPVTNLEPKLKLTNLPYIFPDRSTAYKILDGDIGKEMIADLPTKHQIRILGFFENGFRSVTNSKHEILAPKDLKGLKIRTPQSPVSLAIFKALGANPTPMAFGELYSALETKTVDGQENPLANIYNSKFHEVQKFLSVTNHMYSATVLTISEKIWSGLSPEQQKIIQEASNVARDYERKLSADDEAGYLKKLEEAGIKISKPDPAPFIEATKDVHKEFDKEYGEAFYQKVLEASKK
jgi:tripartite ATP-independent transporter DctP family solute receptor